MKLSPRLAGLRVSNLRMAHLVTPLALAAILVSLWLLAPGGSQDGPTMMARMVGRLTPSHAQKQSSLPKIQALLSRIAEGSSAREALVKELVGTPSAYAPLSVTALLDQLAKQPQGSGSLQSLFGRGIVPLTGSCAHRSEHSAYPWAPLPVSPTFEKVAAAYDSFHARCTAAGGNITQLISSGATPPL